MKKLFKLFAVIGIIFFSLKGNAQTPTISIPNFASTCIKPTAPRQLILTFSVTVSNATVTSVIFTTTNGYFNNQPGGLTVNLINNTANNVVLTYTEITPQSTVPIMMTFYNGTILTLRQVSDQNLIACGNFCATNFLNPTVQGGFGNTGSQLATAIYPQAGPGLVTGVSAIIDSIYRRSVCGTTISAWTPTTITTTTGSQNFNPARNYSSQGSDFFIYSTAPAKLNTSCKEEYRYRVTVTVTFQNGCTKTVSKTVTATRP